MRLIEADSSGLRAAIIRLRSLNAQCRYTLIPVFPVGERRYYDELLRELEQHDVVLHEAFDHPFERGLLRDYEKIAASPRIRLLTSRAVLGSTTVLERKRTHIGASAEDFGDERPLRQHWRALLVRRFILTWLGWFGDRIDLFNRFSTINHGASPALQALRRRLIQSKLQRFHETAFDKPISIAILVAIERMPVISRYLIDRHYFDNFHSHWLKVFSWQTPEVTQAHAQRAGSAPLLSESPGPDADAEAQAFLRRRARARHRRWVLVTTTRASLQLLLRVGLGAGLAATVYFGWLSFKTLPYRWEDMDWNDDGRVTLGEFLEVGGTDIRRIIRDRQLCTEVYSRHDGSVLKSHCYP
jgi:hypothetical protein